MANWLPYINFTPQSKIVMAEILVEELISGTTLTETLAAQAKGRPSKTKKQEEEEADLDEEETAPKKGGKSKDDDDDEDGDDDFEGGGDEEDDDWDPDFDEFDVPKSKKR